MKVRVLHIEECPSWEETGTRTRQALDGAGMADVAVEFVVIRTSDEAAASTFAGSPTIVVNDVDLFPSDGQTTSLACRVYFTEHGLTGAPTRTQIERALQKHI